MVARIWGSNPFDELIDKATSEFLPKGQEDLGLNLDISDQIRSKSVPAKEAMRALKRRIDHSNPNVQLLALSLTDTCVKNGGHHFLIDIASREFVDNLVSILRSTTCNSEVRSKILSLIQTWGIAFDGKPELSYVSDTYRLLKEDYSFPKLEKAASSVMIDTATPPEWTDSDVCMRCRTQFTTFNRKHHCRNCGQTFCGECSSKTMALPHIGINDPVRVCDSCHIKRQLKKSRSTSIDQTAHKSPQNSVHSRTSSLPNGSNNTANSRHEDEDDEDIKKAIELSLKEAESSRGFTSFQQKTTPKVVEQPKKQEPVKEEEEDADLAAAIAASLQEMNLNQQRSNYSSSYVGYDLSAIEAENIYKFSEIVERIQQNGGDLMRERQVQELCERIGELKPKLTKTLSETIQKHQNLVDIHEKLSQVVKLYDRLLEERLSSAYTRRASTTPYSLHQHQQVNPVGTQGVGSFYPNINTTAQTPNLYPQLNYPAASAPAQSPTYYSSQSILANQQSHSNQTEQQAYSNQTEQQAYSNQTEQQAYYSQQYTQSKQVPYTQYSYAQQTPTPYAPVAGTTNNDAIVPTNPIEYRQVNVNHQQQSINGVESYSILQGYQDTGYQQQSQQIDEAPPLIEL
ncbi:10273_t:CDS:10 [Ambispora gerdemannii]|uniref:Vacuolar protein sorting-associated protein 27 n=1 Tax=Ambispora gerdemannii TaxID=144530 RepID=A0A9N9FKX2_9GLOM|nr:10273_t:CDS:10 [Ambispora gerdemannii]